MMSGWRAWKSKTSGWHKKQNELAAELTTLYIEIGRMAEREQWREEKLQFAVERERAKLEIERLRLELERERRQLPPASHEDDPA